MAKHNRKHNKTTKLGKLNDCTDQINNDDVLAVRESRVKSRRAKRIELRQARDKREYNSDQPDQHPLHKMKRHLRKRDRVYLRSLRRHDLIDEMQGFTSVVGHGELDFQL